MSVFVCSYCSGFREIIVEYRIVFKNFCFCALSKSLFFCGYPLLFAFSNTSVFVLFLSVFVQISVNTFSKTGVFLPFLYKNGAI